MYVLGGGWIRTFPKIICVKANAMVFVGIWAGYVNTIFTLRHAPIFYMYDASKNRKDSHERIMQYL